MNQKLDETIDSMEKASQEHRADVQRIFDKIDIHGHEIMTRMDQMCITRQSGCSRLMEERMVGVCRKIESLKEARGEAWQRQGEFNRDIASRIGMRGRQE